jgi:hypothetical protein
MRENVLDTRVKANPLPLRAQAGRTGLKNFPEREGDLFKALHQDATSRRFMDLYEKSPVATILRIGRNDNNKNA